MSDINHMRDLLRAARPFVAFNVVELRELLGHMPASAQPGAEEQVARRIADIEKLVAEIDEAVGQ